MTPLKMPTGIAFDHKQGAGTTVTLSSKRQPEKGEVVIKLPEQETIVDDEVEQVMKDIVQFLKDALQAEQKPRELKVRHIRIEISGRNVKGFEKEELDYFLEKFEHYFSHWPMVKRVHKADIYSEITE